MAVETAVAEGLSPVMAFALVGGIGVGAQWLAWRLRMPAIVLMLGAGLVIGPLLGLFDPGRDIGPLMQPMISIAVAIILFEGGLTLNFHHLRSAAEGVRRLVVVGAPLGWLLSTLALRYVAGLSWEASLVFGGIMIVTGPTVIAPLLRQARLPRRPAQLLHWEAIVNDPIGALAAVLAFEMILVMRATETMGDAVLDLVLGISLATALGIAGGWGVVRAFRRELVPQYMKVPLLFAMVLGVFALSDGMLHESGLLAVTVMGLWIANAELPSYDELRRFKEHATILLVSGVFVVLAASLKPETLMALDWRTGAFVVVVILVVRPATVLVSFLGTKLPMNERLLVGFTGPRGVVLVAVAGLFAQRLYADGVEDAARLTPIAFALVAATVILHGFTMSPMARALGLSAAQVPGVLIAGGSRFAASFGLALKRLEVPVLVADSNRTRLRSVREAGLPIFVGNILSEAAEHGVEFISYGRIVALSDNDALNTLITTDLAPEFGHENVYQLKPAKQEQRRHAMPVTLGGRSYCDGLSYLEIGRRMGEGWEVQVLEWGLDDGPDLESWRAANPDAVVLAEVKPGRDIRLIAEEMEPNGTAGWHLVYFAPMAEEASDAASEEASEAPAEPTPADAVKPSSD
ncbi:cation:proton antiporter [Roseovarius nubinhibens]|uniref:Sodium/hydrogen exchanger n=1 Tax=Roseovarius nubinhibens (strain ATCC BAA-591 / DSM 15170 / ISM) TaxID=89187 RepID=A3SPT1_ROSNI|nr:sodium:proton antiporter [Roseovarius nubinhibens]EAP76471.1 Sodium/hydrogen exchanger [Roseovarius nubinhibens ISM]